MSSLNEIESRAGEIDTQLEAQTPKTRVVIGCRWKPGSIERYDRETGFYEAVNPDAEKLSDILIQRALLAPVRNRLTRERCEAALNARRVGRALGAMA